MRTRIKICGLTSPEEAAFLPSNQVDYAGMVLFYPKSRRNITIEKAREIMKVLPPEIKKTAVTVSPTLEQVKLIEEAGFDVLQIHGHLAEDISAEAGIPIIRAVNVKGRVPVMESYPRILPIFLMRQHRAAANPLIGHVWRIFRHKEESSYWQEVSILAM